MTRSVTMDELRELVIVADRDTMCAKLESLDETRRASLAEEALPIAVVPNHCWGPGGAKEDRVGDDPDGFQRELLDRLGEQKYADWRLPRWTANLMVLGLCDPSVLLKAWDFNLDWLREDLADMPERVLQILLARQPKWLESWLEKEWKKETSIPNGYVEGGLVQAGLVTAQPGEDFLNRIGLDLLGGLNPEASSSDKGKPPRRRIKDRIAADPDFLNNRVWWAFEFDSDILRHCHKRWGNALIELTDEGKIDRDELLRRCVAGMALPLRPGSLRGTVKIHEMLKPTRDEQERLIHEYLQLFGSSESTVVGVALKTCEGLTKAKRLDGVAYFDALPAVFRIDKKAQPQKALTITKQLIKQDAAWKSWAAIAVSQGLQHENTDIQATCVKILESLPTPLPSEAQSIVARARDSVAPSLQLQVDRLLQLGGAETASASAPADPKVEITQPESEQDLTGPPPDLMKQVDELPQTLRDSAGITTAVDQWKAGLPLTVEPIPRHLIPRRDPSRLIAPVENIKELIELVATTMESIQDVMDLERILDGISRLRMERPADFDKRTAPLKKRIQKLSEPYSGHFLDTATEIGFTQLLMTWLEMPPIQNVRSVNWSSMRGWFLRERISSVTEAIVCSRNESWPTHETPLPQLALPTHKGGWIDPCILVERINENYVKHRELTNYHDLAQALLRLMPDGRPEALEKLGKPDHYNGGFLLRYALGGSCELKTYGGWGSEVGMVAAVRARQVIEPELTAALPIATAGYRADQSVVVDGAVIEDPTVPFSLAEVALSSDRFFHGVKAPDDKDFWLDTWESLTNPNDTEAGCMAGHLRHLLEPESTWTYAACRLFVRAAADERGENRIYATDGLASGIARALVPPSSLGQAIADMLPFIKLNRLSKVLGEVVVESILHRWIISEAIEHALSQLDSLPKDIHLLLGLLLESRTVLGTPISEPARTKLSAVSGTSKTAKLAKQLLSHAPRDDRRSELNTAVLETLVERGHRWHQNLK